MTTVHLNSREATRTRKIMIDGAMIVLSVLALIGICAGLAALGSALFDGAVNFFVRD